MIRGLSLANWCCICCNEETVDHILLLCPAAHSSWDASKFWDSMVHARVCSKFIFWLVAMGWETKFKYLKFGPKLFEVDHLDGMESLLL